ncbi:MAG: universal stress protein [Bacteroidota bacterium]
MKQLFCPTDFSKASQSAVEYAAALAVASDAHLRLAHFYEIPALYSDAPLTAIHDAVGQLASLAQSKITRIEKRLKKKYPGLRMDHLISQGIGSQSIVEAAESIGADMIVMGATGAGRVKRLLIGSTAAKVLRHAHCSVIIVPAGRQFKGLPRIGFATDLNEDNLQAAAALVPFAKAFDSELDFVFVDDRHMLHTDESVDRMTKRIRSRINYPSICGYLVTDTDVVKGIRSFLKKRKCDLMVLYTHERNFPETLFHSSVTRLVSEQASLPVLSLKVADRPV